LIRLQHSIYSMHYYSQFTRSQFTGTIIIAFQFPHLLSTLY